MTVMLGSPVSDAAECRRMAEVLKLNAVGVIRTEGGRRRVAWWASPGTDLVPLDRILSGHAPGWISCPRGDDLIFAHLTDGSSVRSVAALSAMLGSLAGESMAAVESTEATAALGEDALEDPSDRARTLAYAVHDGLTQVVTASVLELEWLARQVDVEPASAIASLVTAAEELRKALEEIRGVLASLTPQAEVPGQPLDELVRGVMERWQLPASWSIEGDLNGVPGPVLEAASSVIRESVANAAKHSTSNDVEVRVQASRNALEVRIQDGGRGFQPAGTGPAAGHLGLEMMRRRVADVNGTLDIESSPGKGTRVVARLPVSDQGVKP